MASRIAAGLGLLVLLKFAIWPWLDQGEHRFSGSMLAAYAIVFVALATYRAVVRDRERSGLDARLALARAGRTVPPPARPGIVDQFELLALASLGVGTVLALSYAPEERTMKMLQRIFYVHVPSAWVAFLAFAVVAVASIVYLATRRPGADQVARSSAEVGVVFTTLVLVTGPIWAKPAWGIWWTWDARLTTTLMLWIVYVGYLMLRAKLTDPDVEATLGAVVGIAGLVMVVIDYMAIRWWRTQHPAPVMGGGEGSGLDPMMLKAFLWNLVAFTLVYLALLLGRIAVARLEAANAELEVED